MGADLSKVHFIGRVSDPQGRRPFDPATDMPALQAEAAAIPGLRLLIVDPVVSAVAGDSHKNAEVRRGLQPVVDFAEARGVAALGITHFSKNTQGRDPLERLTGSLAFGALARLAFAAAKVKDEAGEEYRAFVRVKSNLGPDGGGFRYTLEPVEFASGICGLRVLWGEPLTGEARQILAEAEADEGKRGAYRDAEDFLREMLGDGECSAGTIKREAEQSGLAMRTVQEVRKRLGITTRREGMRGGWIWSLPKAQDSPKAQDFRDSASLHVRADSASSEGGAPKAQDSSDSAPSGDWIEAEV
jgi:putative DNA primase/helicase